MASTSSASETELNHSADNVELPLIENNENSYVNDWVDLTVNETIARGAKLLEEVKRQSPKVHKTYDFINVNSKKSPYSESSDKSSRQRKPTRPIIKIQKKSFGPCRSSISPKPRIPSYSCSPQSSRSRSRVGRCPLRTAELAVPSKRYCMATWRDKSETLPILMVQRLKKYVMDESAIVQVSDAITCFQRNRKSPRSFKKKKVSKDRSKVCLTTMKNIQYMMEIRNLCAIFGHNLAKKLILPMDIALNSDWQRVSDVVSEEIAKLMKDKIRFYSDDNHFNKGFREEISNKIAVWIATILEDTSCKLLEEDLRVKKNKERRSGQDENLVTVIENHLISCHRNASELDEEEGPALDFIDDLVNNVMNACIIYSDTESHSDGRAASELSLSKDDSTTDMCNVEPEQITDQSNQSKGETIQEIVNDLINDIITPAFSDKPTTEEGNNKTKDSGEHVNTEHSLNLESDPLTDGEELQYEDAEMNNDKLNPVENSIALEGTRDDISLFNPVVNNQDDNKVSEVLVVLAGEEPLNDKNKKVKFTDLSMAARGGFIEHSRENSIDSNSKSNLIPNLSWVMSFSNKPDILIGPPNEHLLSDADESWPEDVTTPMLRLSESVSRSVTSLGRIIESEEKVSNLQGEENMKQALIVEGLVENRVKTIEPDHQTDNATDQRTPTANDAVIAVDNSGDDTRRISMENIKMLNVAVNCIKVEVSDHATNTSDLIVIQTGGITDDDTDVMEDGDLFDIDCTEPLQLIQEIKVEINKKTSKQISENQITSRDDKKGEIKDTKPTAAIKNNKLITGDALLKDVGKGDHNDDINSEENLILEAVQQIIKLPYVETKIDYRVDPRTAPAWVTYNQPSEDSLLDFSKINETRKLKESEIRKWCKDLEQSFINLEQWNNWVENTCKQITFYKQRGELNKVFVPNAIKNEGRHWVNLKRTVNRDAVLWIKLSKRTQEILKKYRFAKKNTMRLNEEIYEILLKRKHSNEGSILRALDEIDRHSLWIHRLIVSTEYCVKCNCKTFSRN